MFVVRGIAVSLTFFVLLYCLLSLFLLCAWRAVDLWPRQPARRHANLLFWLRIFPLLASAAVTLSLVVPAYIRLEPRAIDEDIALPVALGLGCLLLFGLGLVRVVSAQKESSRVVADWMEGAYALETGVAAPTFQANREAPPLTLVGVCSPRVVVSGATVALLDKDELRVAVRHEVAHMRSRDNLKKLIFHCSPFPGMATLENSWQAAAEVAADDGAVANLADALDLAAALIKLSRLIPVKDAPAFTMALVGASVQERVERLLAWTDTPIPPTRSGWGYVIASLFGMMLCAATLYGPILAQTHKVSEWLVR